MVKGFKSTLFAGAITLSALAPAFAVGPIISGLPDIQVGDLEDSVSTDSNLFVFSDAFQFSTRVSDADTADAALKWSFAEYTNPDLLPGPQYTINGVGPINNGDVAIATEQSLGFPTAKAVGPGTGQINAGGNDFADFRDILFSPGTGSGPFPDPSPTAAAAAAAGKGLRFYVADPEGNVAYQDTLIRTVDDDVDLATESDGYQELVRDTDFTSGWVKSGVVVPTANATSIPGTLRITVQPDNLRYRIYGWVNPALMSYDSVGNGKFVRGKFFISTTNSFYSPVNTVPAFRLRVSNEGAQYAANHFDYATTGQTDPGYEPYYAQLNTPEPEFRAGMWIRPSADSTIPSLYRVDLDPVDVPAAVGSNIGALMESHVLNAPANGTLSLHEVVLATYDAKTDADADGTLLFEYNRNLGFAGGAGGTKSVTGGFFNAENDILDGHRPKYFIPGRDNAEAYGTLDTVNVVADTNLVPTNRFGIVLMNVNPVANINKVRISPDKLYRVRYYATSFVPTTGVAPTRIQGNVRFHLSTGAGTINSFFDMPSLSGFSLGAKGDAMAAQILPGLGNQNPDTDVTLDTPGEDGGWYSVILPSPLDSNGIRKDYNDDFFLFDSEPGPGSPAASARDLVVGSEVFQWPSTLKLGAGTLNYAKPNRGNVRFTAVKVYEYPEIDDGGYDY